MQCGKPDIKASGWAIHTPDGKVLLSILQARWMWLSAVAGRSFDTSGDPEKSPNRDEKNREWSV